MCVGPEHAKLVGRAISRVDPLSLGLFERVVVLHFQDHLDVRLTFLKDALLRKLPCVEVCTL